MNRREFLFSGLSTALVPTLNPKDRISTEIKIEKVNLIYPNLPEDLIDYKFGFISDLHLGGWVEDRLIQDALNICISENVKLLLVGGDLIWVPDFRVNYIDTFINQNYIGDNDEETAELIFQGLSRIFNSVNFDDGIYAVLGNHDRWSNYSAFQTLADNSRVKILLNEFVSIEVGNSKLEIYGSEDYWTGIPIIPDKWKTPKSINQKDQFRLLLTHNPDFASKNFHSNKIKFDLSISGHTHGGQIKFPIIGPLSYNIDDSRYGEGLVEHKDCKIYTSRGLGVVGIPIRMNCPAEVTIFKLTSE